MIDPRGQFDPVKNFYNCPGANGCNTLRHGKLYTCVIPAHVHHLKKFFNLDIALSKRNGIDIYQVKDAEELMQKLAHPIPFCRYCDYAKYEDYADNWSVSIKDKYEWINFCWEQEDLLYLKSLPAVYVYGAGKWGKEVVHKLQNNNIHIEAVLVTSCENNPDFICGIPIISLDSIKTPNKESICILAINGNIKIEIQDKLYNKGFKKIIPIMNL